MNTEYKKLQLPALEYSPNALEPVLIGEILEVHHGKHHNGNVRDFNNL